MRFISSFYQICLGLVLTVTLIALAVVGTLAFRPLYYLDVRLLDIPSTSGYSEEDIRANYDELIDYNLSLKEEKLELPTLPMSEAGRIHFEEVKAIFRLFQYLAMGGTLLSGIGMFLSRRRRKYLYLRVVGICSAALPALLGLTLAVNWDWAFVTFHHIAFDNDYWLFDPKTDPVINILPDAFFLHCALMILALVVLGSLVCGLVYSRTKKRHVPG